MPADGRYRHEHERHVGSGYRQHTGAPRHRGPYPCAFLLAVRFSSHSLFCLFSCVWVATWPRSRLPAYSRCLPLCSTSPDLAYSHFSQVRLLLLSARLKPRAGQTSVWAGVPASLVGAISILAHFYHLPVPESNVVRSTGEANMPAGVRSAVA